MFKKPFRNIDGTFNLRIDICVNEASIYERNSPQIIGKYPGSRSIRDIIAAQAYGLEVSVFYE